jgi:hypothetical protein
MNRIDQTIIDKKPIMKKLILLVFFLIPAIYSHCQDPGKPDTTFIKTKSDSLQQPVQTTQATTAPKQQTAHVRKDNRPLRDRILWDFNTSFWANRQQVLFNASILVSYKFPKILSIGTGPVYVFSYRKDADVSLNGFGAQVVVKAQLLKFFYLWTSYQGLSNQYITEVTTNPVSFTWNRGYVDSWFAGAGVNLRLGRRFGINLSAVYDFLYNSTDSPYTSAFIYQFGFSF